jgi:hypothetical protein
MENVADDQMQNQKLMEAEHMTIDELNETIDGAEFDIANLYAALPGAKNNLEKVRIEAKIAVREAVIDRCSAVLQERLKQKQ